MSSSLPGGVGVAMGILDDVADLARLGGLGLDRAAHLLAPAVAGDGVGHADRVAAAGGGRLGGRGARPGPATLPTLEMASVAPARAPNRRALRVRSMRLPSSSSEARWDGRRSASSPIPTRMLACCRRSLRHLLCVRGSDRRGRARARARPGARAHDTRSRRAARERSAPTIGRARDDDWRAARPRRGARAMRAFRAFTMAT